MFRPPVDGSPTQAWKPGVVAVFGDPFATVINRQCGEPGVLHQVRRGVHAFADGAKDSPVPRSRLDDPAIRLIHQCGCKSQYGTEAIRAHERLRIRGNPYNGGKNLRRHGVWFSAVDNPLEPGPIDSMQFSVAQEKRKGARSRRRESKPSLEQIQQSGAVGEIDSRHRATVPAAYRQVYYFPPRRCLRLRDRQTQAFLDEGCQGPVLSRGLRFRFRKQPLFQSDSGSQ